MCKFCKTVGKINLNGLDKHGVRAVCRACGKSYNGDAFISLLAEHTQVEETGTPRATKRRISWDGNSIPVSADQEQLVKRLDDLEATVATLRTQVRRQSEAITAQQLEIKALQEEARQWKMGQPAFSAPARMIIDHHSPHQPAIQQQHARRNAAPPQPNTTASPAKATPQTSPAAGPNNAARDTPLLGAKEPEPQQPDATHGNHPRKTWAQVAMASELRPAMRNRLQQTMDALKAANLTPIHRQQAQPNPVALYFGNVRRGPIGEYRRILTRFLPGWAVLAMSFIGRSTTEILTHAPYQARLITSMKLLGFDHLPDYDPAKPHTNRGRAPERSASINAMRQCARRWRRCAAGRPRAVHAWYTESAETLDAALEQLQPQHAQESPPHSPADLVPNATDGGPPQDGTSEQADTQETDAANTHSRQIADHTNPPTPAPHRKNHTPSTTNGNEGSTASHPASPTQSPNTDQAMSDAHTISATEEGHEGIRTPDAALSIVAVEDADGDACMLQEVEQSTAYTNNNKAYNDNTSGGNEAQVIITRNYGTTATSGATTVHTDEARNNTRQPHAPCPTRTTPGPTTGGTHTLQTANTTQTAANGNATLN